MTKQKRMCIIEIIKKWKKIETFEVITEATDLGFSNF